MIKYLRGEVKLWKAYLLISLCIFLITLTTQVNFLISILFFVFTIRLIIGRFESNINYKKDRKSSDFLFIHEFIMGAIGTIILF